MSLQKKKIDKVMLISLLALIGASGFVIAMGIKLNLTLYETNQNLKVIAEQVQSDYLWTIENVIDNESWCGLIVEQMSDPVSVNAEKALQAKYDQYCVEWEKYSDNPFHYTGEQYDRWLELGGKTAVSHAEQYYISNGKWCNNLISSESSFYCEDDRKNPTSQGKA